MERAIIANRKHDKGEVRKEMSERKMKRVEYQTGACIRKDDKE